MSRSHKLHNAKLLSSKGRPGSELGAAVGRGQQWTKYTVCNTKHLVDLSQHRETGMEVGGIEGRR